MKPEISCANHPDEEGHYPCRYCGKPFCSSCVQAEPGFYRCRGPECLKAHESEMAGPRRPCPHCGQENPLRFPVCSSCGGELPEILELDGDSPVTVARFLTLPQAQLAQAVLQNQGIESFIADEALNEFYGAGSIFLGGVRLQTRQADRERATALLEGVEKEIPGSPDGSCAYCGDLLDPAQWGSDPGPLHCQKPGCLEAYREEMEKLAKPCPSCGTPGLVPGGVCEKCGKSDEAALSPWEPTAPKAGEGNWGVGQVVLLWLGLMGVEVFAPLVFACFSYARGQLPSLVPARVVFRLSELACLWMVWHWTRNFQKLSWRESLRFLGFKRPNPAQLLAAVVILLPILAGEFFAIQDNFREGGQIHWIDSWKWRLSSYIFGAGLFEETLYRGFLFRFLRQGRSFFPAAAISAGLWSLSHVTHLIPFYGAGFDNTTQMETLLLEVFVDGLLGAYLFEKGGYNIWGWMLVHVVYDCTYLVGATTEFYASHAPRDDFYLWKFVSVALTVPVIRRFLPGKPGGEPEGNPSFPEEGTARRLEARAWKIGLLVAAGLALTLRPLQVWSIQADNRHWQDFMESHPRFGDGPRQWAYDLWTLEMDKDAEEKCQEALAIDPRNDKAWFLWGKILAYQKRYGVAAEKLAKAAQFAPRDPAVFLLWGLALENSDRDPEAVDKYREVLRLVTEEKIFSEIASRRINLLDKPDP